MKVLKKEHNLSKELEHSQKHAQRIEDEIWKTTTPTGQFRYDRKFEIIRPEIKSKKKLKILEIGCGGGELTKRLVKLNIDLVATDISPDLIKITKNKIKSNKIKFIISSVENLKFKDNSLDIVIGNSILHHLNLVIALKEIRRVLKNNGKIIFNEPNMLNPLVFVIKNIRFVGKRFGETEDETAFYRWQIKKILVNSGFTNVKVKNVDFFGNFYPTFLLKRTKTIFMFLEKIPVIKEFSGSLMITGNLKKKK